MTLPHQDNVYTVAAQGHTILEQGLFEESSTQKYDLGHVLRLNDGRTFVYAKAGAVALAKGKLMQSALKNASTDLTACAISEAGSTDGRIGDTTLTPTLNGSTYDLAANELAGGWIVVSDDTGEGNMYKVSSNAAISAGGSGAVTLKDPLRVAVAAATTVDLVISPYSGLIVMPAPATAQVVGVTTIAVTASYYFWLQTYGVCTCLQSGALVAGDMCQVSDTTTNVDGAVQVCDPDAANANGLIVGQCIRPGVDTEYGVIHLTIAA